MINPTKIRIETARIEARAIQNKTLLAMALKTNIDLSPIRWKIRESADFLRKAQENYYVTVSAFIGELTKKEIQDAVKEFGEKFLRTSTFNHLLV